ncbi:hypothetical protein C474_20816 [Halogeometricum pallidum JCM 14848]|uniref:Uncharacterized protein n=1 Tax=Halogeometricum pallidum JCM 14848 TaxID=1227487 RepID=M0CUT8_HALPD|nr:hypothetical protein [Halogeometricum pallidum]ELZ26182.1 hypothetical protein C474_20816 [Halogeometricum pallidum JCM 14848]
MDQGGGAGGAPGDAPGLAAALDGLKQRGSALLIVGSVPADVYRQVSVRMLGDGDAAPRRRLLVTNATDDERDSRLDGVERRTPEWTRIVRFAAPSRGSAAASSGQTSTVSPAEPETATNSNRESESDADTDAGGDPVAHCVDGDVTELGAEVTKTVEQFDAIAGGLTPAELRVAFDCLPVILAEYDLETGFRFAHILANHVRAVDGMAHFWLPRERDDEAVRVLEPLFDATVELCLDGTQLRQRWHFRDRNLSSDWLTLE